MVVLDALTVSNFKRYAGTHRIPLSPEEGTLTIVAAQNGVGKTSLIDALHVGLWGSVATWPATPAKTGVASTAGWPMPSPLAQRKTIPPSVRRGRVLSNQRKHPH